MNHTCRVVSQLDCGSTIYQSNRLPFITGCTVPSFPISLCAESEYKVLPSILQTSDRVGLLLDFYIVNSSVYWHESLFFDYELHQSFLQDISETQAIYLLAGGSIDDHPNHLQTFFLRLAANGQGFEVTNRIRETIATLHGLVPVLKQSTLLSAPSLT